MMTQSRTHYTAPYNISVIIVYMFSAIQINVEETYICWTQTVNALHIPLLL